MTADRTSNGGGTMVTPNPSADGPGASPPELQAPEPGGHTAGSGGQAARPGDGRHLALPGIVSLEAIFLSTFVMIGQNRQAAFQQSKADHDFVEQELELKTNTQLTREIDRLTTELHKRYVENAARRQP
jgi:hypothetical protein